MEELAEEFVQHAFDGAFYSVLELLERFVTSHYAL